MTLLLAACMMQACHKVTEYSSEGRIGVAVISLPDLTVEGTIQGFEGGRAICSLGESDFVVSSNRGRLYWGNSSELTIEDAYTIGTPFSSGYNSIAPGIASVYVIAGYGQIVEFGLSSRTVVDEFTAGPLPLDLCRVSFAPSIYVSDGQDSKLREVWISDNEVHRELELPGPVAALASCDASNSLIIGVSALEGLVFMIHAGSYFTFGQMETAYSSSDVAAMPDTLVFCVTHPELTGGMYEGSGGVTLVREDTLTTESSVLPLEGMAYLASCSPFHEEFYVASYLGGGSTRITAIGAFDWVVHGSVDIDGFPRDMTVHAGSDRLLVLTSE